MKKLLIVLVSGFFVWSCASQKLPDRQVSENLILEEEGEEYELTIIDPSYNSWFATNAKPVSYYSESYYENKNQMYVNSWNYNYDRTGGSGPFGNRIDYDPSIDYGLELNYELFWYFKYIEAKYGNYYNFPI